MCRRTAGSRRRSSRGRFWARMLSGTLASTPPGLTSTARWTTSARAPPPPPHLRQLMPTTTLHTKTFHGLRTKTKRGLGTPKTLHDTRARVRRAKMGQQVGRRGGRWRGAPSPSRRPPRIGPFGRTGPLQGWMGPPRDPKNPPRGTRARPSGSRASGPCSG
ncbi:hypothetical protein T484DRAFT_1923413 [Baffinella frigidus]|nr:hypothetical protein T484DRAFT_1923413 [Cryptophyta sp. CCMP2293]